MPIYVYVDANANAWRILPGLGGPDECQIYTTASCTVESIFTRSYLFLFYLDRVHLTEYSTSSTNHHAMPCLPSALGQGLGAAFGLETRSR